jgi:hypothetical protein
MNAKIFMCHLDQPSLMEHILVIKKIVPGHTTCSYEIEGECLESGQERHGTLTFVLPLQPFFDDA